MEIDRLSPCKRPQKDPVGYQTWRDLLFIHWSVDPHLINKILPEGIYPDLYNGEAFIGVIPFYMKDVRPKWAPRWSAFNFFELNVRTYVLCNGEPGVFFFSLDAASWIAVCAARLGWSLPYYPAQFSQTFQGDYIHYQARRLIPRGAQFDLGYRLGEDLGPAQPHTLEHFLIERYVLFTQHRGVIYRGRVHHQPYPIQTAELIHCTTNLLDCNGLTSLEQTPRHVHYSKGVEVEIFALNSIL